MACVVFCVLLFSGLGISWSTQSKKLKQALTEHIETLNNGVPYITYEKLETSGFPWNVYLSITDLRFTGRLDVFLSKMLVEGDPKKFKELFPDMRVWNEDLMFEGKITLGVNALSDRYSLKLDGTLKNSTFVDNNLINHHVKMDAPVTCSLELKRKRSFLASLWDITVLGNVEPRDFAEDLKELNCSFPPAQVYDSEKNEVMASKGNSQFSIVQNLDGNKRSTRLYVKSDNIEVTPLGDSILHFYTQIVEGPEALPPRLTDAGKQNAELDFSYEGPADLKDLTTEAMDVSLNKAYVESNQGLSNMTFRYTVVPDGDTRDVNLLYGFQLLPKPGFDDMLKNRANDYLHYIYTRADPKLAAVQKSLSKYEEEAAYDIIVPAIPNMEPLGAITQQLSLNYKGTNQLKTGELTLNQLEVGFTPYGIQAQGSLRLSEDQLPDPDFNVTCRNCTQMLNDGVAYVNRLHNSLAKFDAQTAAPLLIDPFQFNGFKEFLTKIARVNAAAPDDLNYMISGDSITGEISINGRPLSELETLYSQLVSQPAPAAQP
jgi:hypothetical protein